MEEMTAWHEPGEARRAVGHGGMLWGMCLVLVCVVLLSLRLGSAQMNGTDFFRSLLRWPGYETGSFILYGLRLPRVMAGVLAGMGLSVSGVLLQSVTGNGMAAPNLIGVNAGAGFSVVLLLFLFPAAAVFALPFAAFVGAFLTTLIIVMLAGKLGASKTTIILAGLACTAILNAGISFLALLDTDVLASYSYFSSGSLSGVRMEQLALPAVAILACFLCALALARRIDLLCLGDGMAVSLGVRVKPLRMVCLICASAAAAAVVSFAGLLGFVGLIVPHIARRLTGFRIRPLLLSSALCGGILVVLGDLLGRLLFAPSELPVGIVMAFVGAPFFLFLLLRRRTVF